jgi:hypothetical protein
MLIVKSLGSTNKGVDRVHNKYNYHQKKGQVIPLRVHQCLGSRLNLSVHSKLANFSIIMNKWTVLKLLQKFKSLLSKNVVH